MSISIKQLVVAQLFSDALNAAHLGNAFVFKLVNQLGKFLGFGQFIPDSLVLGTHRRVQLIRTHSHIDNTVHNGDAVVHHAQRESTHGHGLLFLVYNCFLETGGGSLGKQAGQHAHRIEIRCSLGRHFERMHHRRKLNIIVDSIPALGRLDRFNGIRAGNGAGGGGNTPKITFNPGFDLGIVKITRNG